LFVFQIFNCQTQTVLIFKVY